LTVDVFRTGQVRLDLAQLETHALELLQDDEFAAFSSHVDELLDDDLRGRPRVRLLVALALAQREPDDPRVDQLARAAWRSFQRARDREGLSLAAYVQGRIADARGDLEGTAEWWSRSREVSADAAPLQEHGVVDVGFSAWERSDLPTARRLGAEGVELSRSRDNVAEATRAHALLALLATHEGKFDEAERVIAEALADVDEDTVTTAGMLHCIWGAIAAFRGQNEVAEVEFAKALEAADRHDDPILKGVTLAQRAELLTTRSPEDRLREAWAASALTAGSGPWSRVSVRAVAVSAAAAGDQEASEEAVETLLADSIDGMELGRALFLRANNAAMFGTESPLGLYEQAYAALTSANANFWAASVALAAAEHDEEHRERWRDRAASLSNGDEAFVRLLRTEHRLQLRHTDGGAVLIDDEPAQFLTRHAELTVYLLALAGKEGMDTSDLATRLWPEAPVRRHRPRLRTCLWQVRKAVGDEHWRLRRDRKRVYFETDPHEFDRAGLEKLVENFEL
jgi:tetratricopeptide (TPR) repeat protein